MSNQGSGLKGLRIMIEKKRRNERNITMDRTTQTTAEKAASKLFGNESSEHLTNPFPLFGQMRTEPVVSVPNPFPFLGDAIQTWMVTRMEEAVEVLKDHARFAIERNGQPRSGVIADSSGPATFISSQTMLSVDEPDHRRLRRLVSKGFTPKYIESLRPRVKALADELLDRVQAQGHMDLIKDYAYPLPINVISEMLGVPHADREQIHVWSEALARGLGLGRPDPAIGKHLRAFGEYTAQLVANKRQHPADDLVSQLVAIEGQGDRLSEAELISMITLLIFAGHETTSNLIGTGTMMLLDRPDQLEKLKADLSLVPSAVEELLRYNGPATAVGPRFATADIELGGKLIKKGDMVIAVVKSANHDESQFTEPDELDITRTIDRHLAFGHGIHTCLGAPLARMEGDIAFTTLLSRLPTLRLSVPRESLTWHWSLTSASLAALPVAF
jgi:cytochrome P450